MSIISLNNDSIKGVFYFVDEVDLTHLEWVCKRIRAVVAEYWLIIAEAWKIVPYVKNTDYKGTLLRSCHFYCEATWLFFPHLEKPAFPINNSFLARKILEEKFAKFKLKLFECEKHHGESMSVAFLKTELSLENEPASAPQFIKDLHSTLATLSAAYEHSLNDLQLREFHIKIYADEETRWTWITDTLSQIVDPLNRIQTFQMFCDSGVCGALNQVNLLRRLQPFDDIISYCFDCIQKPCAEHALTCLPFSKVYEAFLKGLETDHFNLPHYISRLISRMSTTDFQLFLDHMNHEILCECFVKWEKAFPHCLFKTKEHYLMGVAMLKSYFSSLREKMPISLSDKLIIHSFDGYTMKCNFRVIFDQQNDSSSDECAQWVKAKLCMLKEKFNQQPQNIKQLQIQFMKSLEATVKAIQDADNKTKIDIAAILNNEIHDLIDKSLEVLKLDDPFIFLIFDYLIKLKSEDNDLFESIAISVFQRINTHPSADLALLIIRSWLKRCTLYINEKGEIGADLQTFFSKLDKPTFRVVIKQITPQFIASAILQKNRSFTSTQVPIGAIPHEIAYADEIVELSAALLQKLMIRYNNEHPYRDE